MTTSVVEYIRNLHAVHLNSLNEEPATAPFIPDDLVKVPLHPHQLAVLSRMEELEQGLMNGLRVKSQTLFSNCGILGDSVGGWKEFDGSCSYCSPSYNARPVQTECNP